MKKTVFYIIVCFLTFIIYACTAQNNISTADNSQLINSGNFSFHAQHANPLDIDVVNVINSMPAMSSSRMLTLDPGYTVDFTKEKITVKLPYFGRMYVGSLDPSKQGFDFTSTDFNISTSKSSGKKTVWLITLKDQPNIQQMYLEIYGTGKAYLSINSTDRQAITYDGIVGKTSD